MEFETCLSVQRSTEVDHRTARERGQQRWACQRSKENTISYIQGGFFYWSALKMMYEEKLKTGPLTVPPEKF